MKKDNLQRYVLADDQIDMLIDIVREESGDGLMRFDLDNRMLALFEDIAGFETLPAKMRRKYLQLLWLRYQVACHGK